MKKSIIMLIFLTGFFAALGCGSDEADPGSSQGQAFDDDAIDDDSSNDDDASDDDSPDDDDDDESFLPADSPGPYRTGAIEKVFYDPARDRSLPSIIWYPTEDRYGRMMTFLLGLVVDDGAFADAAISADGPFPLIVFSHGLASFDFQSFSIMDFLATHGYIVVACAHLQNTTLTYLDTTYFAKSAVDRPQDVTTLIDGMLEFNQNPGSRFYGKIDPEKIGVIGHSFGGYTSIAALGPPLDLNGMIDKCNEIGQENWHGEWSYCVDATTCDLSYVDDCHPCSHGDDRIKVSIPMAPAFPYLIAEGGLAQIDIPVLIMAAELDDTTPPDTQNRVYFDGLTHPGTLFWELAGGNHLTFSSACEIDIARRFFPCGDEFIDISVAHYLINTASVAYLGLHLKTDDRYEYYFSSEYLAGFPQITLERK